MSFFMPFPSKKYAFALKKFLESETLYEKGEKASNQNVEFFDKSSFLQKFAAKKERNRAS